MSLKVGQANKQMGVVAVKYFVVIDLLDDQVDEVEQLPIAPAARWLFGLLLRADGFVFVRCVG